MNGKRVLSYGFLLWFLPFAVSFLIFGIKEDNRALFESLITVIGVTFAVTASVLYFRDILKPGFMAGLTLGIIWAGMSIIIDLPIFLFVFSMSLPEYLADIALTYMAFPAITVGIAIAIQMARKQQ